MGEKPDLVTDLLELALREERRNGHVAAMLRQAAFEIRNLRASTPSASDEVRQLRIDNARLRDEAFLRDRAFAQLNQE